MLLPVFSSSSVLPAGGGGKGDGPVLAAALHNAAEGMLESLRSET
jgi:hypothetical protein